MTGILGKLHVEHSIHGAKVVVRSHQLTGDCLTDGEIDTAIELLKGDLRGCPRRGLCDGRIPVRLYRRAAGQPCRGRVRRADRGQPLAVH
jgi:hypothetical protein